MTHVAWTIREDQHILGWNVQMESSAPSEDKEYELTQRILKLWERYRPLCMERLSVIEEAHAAALSTALDDQARRSAESAAHKLAGALGSIGLPEGSVTAAEIEALLQPESTLADVQLFRLSELLANLRSQLTRGPTVQDDSSKTR
jgi:HPt (histidine-containing phosphotransfer) domain-containing protein